MKIIHETQNKYVVCFDKGEKWPDVFLDFCDSNDIQSAFFYGLGGLIDPEIAYYDLEGKKEYVTQRIEGIYEVLSIVGNIAQYEEKLAVHSHITLGKKDYSVVGGHLVRATVGGTLELYVNILDSIMERRIDEDTGLNLLQ